MTCGFDEMEVDWIFVPYVIVNMEEYDVLDEMCCCVM
jgi:hypothetical protein